MSVREYCPFMVSGGHLDESEGRWLIYALQNSSGFIQRVRFEPLTKICNRVSTNSIPEEGEEDLEIFIRDMMVDMVLPGAVIRGDPKYSSYIRQSTVECVAGDLEELVFCGDKQSSDSFLSLHDGLLKLITTHVYDGSVDGSVDGKAAILHIGELSNLYHEWNSTNRVPPVHFAHGPMKSYPKRGEIYDGLYEASVHLPEFTGIYTAPSNIILGINFTGIHASWEYGPSSKVIEEYRADGIPFAKIPLEARDVYRLRLEIPFGFILEDEAKAIKYVNTDIVY